MKKQQKPKPAKTASAAYYFERGVTVDARGDAPEARYEVGARVRAGELPPHIDLSGLLAIGAVRPIEDVK